MCLLPCHSHRAPSPALSTSGENHARLRAVAPLGATVTAGPLQTQSPLFPPLRTRSSAARSSPIGYSERVVRVPAYDYPCGLSYGPVRVIRGLRGASDALRLGCSSNSSWST